jgi:choline dehydrogenase-like flavoprotein
MPGVHLCDSSCFPDAPAVSPTFTIMANAARIARGAIGEAIVPAGSSRIGTTTSL